jgi:hypothetical protein
MPLLQDFKKWRDPDSNRGHHDFQLGKARSPLFLTAQKSAWITGSCIIHEHQCSPLSKRGCRHNCRQLPEKAILRTLLEVVLQFEQKLGADERTRTADLISLRVCGQGLLSIAQACKSRIDNGFPVPYIDLPPSRDKPSRSLSDTGSLISFQDLTVAFSTSVSPCGLTESPLPTRLVRNSSETHYPMRT